MYNQQTAEELRTTRWVDVQGCDHVARFKCAIIDSRHPHSECPMADRAMLGITWLKASRTCTHVEPGSLAERIGFRLGDVLVALDHTAVSDLDAFTLQISDPNSPGHVVTVQRGSKQVDISVPRLGN